LIVTVTDASDVPITPILAQTNFTLYEGGAPQTINPFSNTVPNPIPLSVVLLLDYSISLTGYELKVEDAAKYFLDSLGPNDEAAVIKFAGAFDLASDFKPISTEKPALKDAIDKPYTKLEGTRLYDAVYDALQRLANRDPAKRRTAIVVSDGVDFLPPSGGQLSTYNLENVIDSGQDNKVFIYTLGLGQDLNIGAVTMGRMADETGGEFIVSPTADDMRNVYFKVATILENQYELTFTTARSVGTSNSLKVAVDTTVLQGDNSVTVTY
jgi:VWFA-related protein